MPCRNGDIYSPSAVERRRKFSIAPSHEIFAPRNGAEKPLSLDIKRRDIFNADTHRRDEMDISCRAEVKRFENYAIYSAHAQENSAVNIPQCTLDNARKNPLCL